MAFQPVYSPIKSAGPWVGSAGSRLRIPVIVKQ
jgi:hypothetical protein